MDSSDQWDWSYTFKVGARTQIENRVLGRITVIPIEESRWVYDGNYTSKMSILFHMGSNIPVRYEYRDDKGKQVCELSEFSNP